MYFCRYLQEIVADIIGAKLCSTPDSYYNTPLHIAAKLGHLDAVRVLIGNSMGQVKLDSKNDLGKTAMHLAAEFGHVRFDFSFHVVETSLEKVVTQHLYFPFTHPPPHTHMNQNCDGASEQRCRDSD